MASFHGKIGWGRQRKRENKNYRSVQFLAEVLEKIPQKQQKNLKNTVMASFQAKICWKMQRKRVNKNYCSVSFLPDPQQKIPQKQQKNSKN